MAEYYAQQLAYIAQQQSLLKRQIDTHSEPKVEPSSYIPRYEPKVSDAWPAVFKILTQSEIGSTPTAYIAGDIVRRGRIMEGEETGGFEERPGELVEEFGEPINLVHKLVMDVVPQPPPIICNPLADAPPSPEAAATETQSPEAETALQIPIVERPVEGGFKEIPKLHVGSQEVPSTPPNQMIPESNNAPRLPHKPACPLIVAMPLDAPEYVASYSVQSAWKSYGGQADQQFYLLLAKGAHIADDEDAESLEGDEVRIENQWQLKGYVDRFPILEAFLESINMPIILIRPKEDLKWAIQSHLQGLQPAEQHGSCLVLVSSLMGEEVCAEILNDSPIPVALLK